MAIHFPTDYAEARRRFRDTARRLGWSQQAHRVGGTSPAGDDLTIDVAVSPGPDTGRVLVVSSGLHGVEGPLGSAIQTELMERWSLTSGPGRARGVLLHALNPYGFAWSRRVDSDNVDLNRNFLDDGAAYSGAPAAYRVFDSMLNPRRPPSRWDAFPVRAAWAVAVHGRDTLRAALVTGQYGFPQGLFFGGKGPSATFTLVSHHLPSWLGHAEAVVHLDIHTGLGAWGTHKLLIDYPLGPGGRDRLTRWFGAQAFPDQDPARVTYQARGSFGPWLVARRFAPDYTFAFAEFGTYPEVRVLEGLRAENQVHHWGGDTRTVHRVKARLRELFCPASPAWRARTLADGLDLVERALNGLVERDRPGRTR
jgi:hypothetical protein